MMVKRNFSIDPPTIDSDAFFSLPHSGVNLIKAKQKCISSLNIEKSYKFVCKSFSDKFCTVMELCSHYTVAYLLEQPIPA